MIVFCMVDMSLEDMQSSFHYLMGKNTLLSIHIQLVCLYLAMPLVDNSTQQSNHYPQL